MLVTKFLDLDIESKSLYIRELFEQAAKNFHSRLNDELVSPKMIIREKKIYLDVTDENAKILTSYNEKLFPEKDFFSLGDDGFKLILVTKEIFTRYCSAKVLSTIPELTAIGTENDWRSDYRILDTDSTEPLIVFRGVVANMTESFLHCSAHTIITQQLLNYQNVMLKKATQAPDLFNSLSFPKVEGRGAVFCFSGVPFHAFNSRAYNDQLGKYLELYQCDYNKIAWKLDIVKLNECGFTLTKLTPKEGVSLLPEISLSQAYGRYHTALRIPLTSYIVYSLQYQKSLAQVDRIPNDLGQRASTDAIDLALNRLVPNAKFGKRTPSLPQDIKESLAAIKLKMDYFKENNFSSAEQAADTLIKNIPSHWEKYYQNSAELQKHIEKDIKDAHLVFDKHRGMKQILNNILFSIVTLFIQPFINYTKYGRFFQHLPTNSELLLNKLEDTVRLHLPQG